MEPTDISDIGILGGGQLGRMLVQAAHQLGFKCHIYCPEENSPAAQIADHSVVASYGDQKALREFAATVDVATFEFENIPVESVNFLTGLVPVFPGSQPLAISQDRQKEKSFVQALGAETVAYAVIDRAQDIPPAMQKVGCPAILKSRSEGYDGKGQRPITDPAEAEEAWQALGERPAILEAFIDFDCEISVVAARDRQGNIVCYEPALNRHVNHILDTSIVPSGIDTSIIAEAKAITATIVEKLDYVGVMAVEFFVTRERKLLINEFAPRVHNSGHWTIEACQTSQFEQHIRAVTGMALGNAECNSAAIMKNLIGDEVNRLEKYASAEYAVHLYGKGEARPGRKMGHVTRLYAPDELPSESPSELPAK